MATKDVFSYDEEFYLLQALKSGSLTDAEMRKEYTRLRAVAVKRLQRFEGTEYEEAKSYRMNKDKFKKLSEMEDRRELIYLLNDVARFLSAKSSSVSGLKATDRQILETAHERGLTWLKKDNLRQFGEFMEDARAKGYAKIYGSERVAEIFGTAYKKGINPEEVKKNFDFWIEHQSELAKQPKIKNEKQRTADEYRKRIENKKKPRKKR